MKGHIVLKEKEGKLFRRFQKLSARYWTRKFHLPTNARPRSFWLALKLQRVMLSSQREQVHDRWASATPFWPSRKRNPPEFTAFERCGTCILACCLLDFVRVLVRILSDFTIYRFNPNRKSVGPCKHFAYKESSTDSTASSLLTDSKLWYNDQDCLLR